MGLTKRIGHDIILPQPFSFAPSLLFEGNDGSWSTFIVRIGTPPQTFRVIISTSGQETWVPLAQGCLDVDPLNCGELRGVNPFQNAPSNGFNTNQSSTWELDRLYGLALEDSLVGYSGNGMYGLDTVGLQVPGSGGPSLDRQIVAGITTKNFMFGLFALGPKPTNFSDFNAPQPSFMWSLKNQSMIPSLSYGYQAGASYDNALGSLVLGGYDATQLDTESESTPEFSFNVDLSVQLTVGLQSAVATNTLEGVVALLPEASMVIIDSAVPELWLPVEACAKFESSFGLQLDNATGRYLVNETTHARLNELNPSFTFKIGNTTSGGQTTNIELPYAAFDLQADYPIFPNATNYFPLRQSVNDTPYVLGRTFLQEAYIVVDYERSKLAISQRVQRSHLQQNIVTIMPTGKIKRATYLEKRDIIGIVIGTVFFLLVLLVGGYLFFKRNNRKKGNQVEEHTVAQDKERPMPIIGEISAFPYEVHDTQFRTPAQELGPARPHELSGRQARVELEGS